MRAVYLFTSGPPDTRVELHVPLDRSRPQVPTLATAVVPGQPVRTRAGRPLRHRAGRPSPAPPPGAPPALAGRLASRCAMGRAEPPEMVADAGSFPFVPVEGAGVYEIPVGPVHAGLIEPGHFRFWVVGETILRMKARLWFVHKGIERLFEGKDIDCGPRDRRADLRGHRGRPRARLLPGGRGRPTGSRCPTAPRSCAAVLLELERLYNHVADIGALCNDVGFGLAHAWALSLREQLLQLNARDHRPPAAARRRRAGGRPAPPPARPMAELAEIGRSLRRAGGARRRRTPLSWSASPARRRSTASHARDLGVVGVAGRASGLAFDARVAHPFVDLSGRVLPGTALRWRRTGPLRRSGSTKRGHRCRSSPTSSTGPTLSTPWSSARWLFGAGPVRRGRGDRRGLAGGRRPSGRTRRPGAPLPGQGRRSFVPQLARPARVPGRHDRPGLPAGQQELQPLLRRATTCDDVGRACTCQIHQFM